jgi:alkanesulfonate monooxygenase SsuD/methylene tetrahydromethanopterin reductase-like flavin-dependent oxidoreductase (luciferase family)
LTKLSQTFLTKHNLHFASYFSRRNLITYLQQIRQSGSVLRKLKFGVFLPFYAFPEKNPKEHFNQLRNTVLECEKLGYDSVWLDDHLTYRDWLILECWTTLSALAARTNKIRLGTMVTCNAHRNPALLAKMAATVDVLSGGRLEFGIGAGSQEVEHIAYGLGFPKLGDRTDQLSEALEIIKQLWTTEKANYIGKYYSVKDAVCIPKPPQKPHPPLTVGGCSPQLLLKATAHFADRFDWGYLPIEAYKRKLEVLEKNCRAVDRGFEEIEKSCWPGAQVIIAKNQKALEEKISEQKPVGASIEDFKKTALVGTPDECIEQIGVFEKLGVTYFMLFFSDLPSLESLKLFAQTVVGKSA